MPATRAKRVMGGNRLLGALAADEPGCPFPPLEEVSIYRGQLVYETGEPTSHVFFPVDAVFSLLSATKAGKAVAVGVVGCEGMVGFSALSEVDAALNRVVAQVSGRAMMMEADALRTEFRRSSAVQSLLLRYTRTMFMQLSQSAFCNRRHTVAGRLARWLLMIHDRIKGDEFPVTQESIAGMLGSRRAGITAAASALKQAGAITYLRGTVSVIDRPALETAACECYAIVREELSRSLRF